ncbi:Protein kinase-like domain protein [Metarhizium guizhouense ARSEF 977]|uniref:EKC/KEOPS complex subunit BUD32 n=1 Tax=Metarhizium guizhouense (strain ARSEF 977) TaxID=1276136 RepID=A0A0B4GAX0_METGA|nr:Protein kinase-like domain protein [Metarhizium guizhouense ARSEF 977]
MQRSLISKQPSFWKTWRQLLIGIYLKLYSLTLYALRLNVSHPDANSTELVTLPAASFPGSTALFFRLRPGIILKAPVKVGEDEILRKRDNVDQYFSIEEQILSKLGKHPRIVRLLGARTEFPTGLLFAEASHGNLQSFLHQHGNEIAPSLRHRWFIQAIESIVFVHSKGVIHSDLRPENFLVHGTLPLSLDLWLCDFGGSTCEDLQLSGGKLPNSGFFNPNDAWEATYAVDIFALGSVLYTIITGRWPFRATTGQFTSVEEMEEYDAYVDGRFADGIFPEVGGLFGGEIIRGCWTNQFSRAGDVMASASQLQIKY